MRPISVTEKFLGFHGSAEDALYFVKSMSTMLFVNGIQRESDECPKVLNDFVYGLEVRLQAEGLLDENFDPIPREPWFPAFQEMGKSREALRLAWERAVSAIDPFLDECVATDKTHSPANVLAMLSDRAHTDWPWERAFNDLLAKVVAERLHRLATQERYVRSAEKETK